MIQLEPLWKYQKADLALFRFERGLKKSETRNKLLQVRNRIMEQQNSIKRLEQQLKKSQTEYRRIAEALNTAKQKAEQVNSQLSSGAYTEIKQVRQAIRQMDEATKALNADKKLLQDMAQIAGRTEKMVKDARAKMLEDKAEFDKLKVVHDAELAKATPELERLNEEVKAMEPDLDKALLAKYKQIKKNRVNPIALVQNNQCQGCNMSLPSLTLSKLKEQKELVECENCGRILYVREGKDEE